MGLLEDLNLEGRTESGEAEVSMQSLALLSKLTQPLLGLQQRAQEPHSLEQLVGADHLLDSIVQQPSALECSFAAKAECEAHLWILF